MNPLRVNNALTAKATGTIEDSYIQKVVKYIPIEVIASYTAMRAFLLQDVADVDISKHPELLPYGPVEDYKYYAWIFFICLIVTPIYKYFSLKDDSLPVPLRIPYYQIVISIIAFLVWVYAFGDYFEITLKTSYDHKAGALILMAFTLVVPLVERFFSKNE